VSIADLVAGRITARQVIRWLENQPPGNAVERSMLGEDAEWTLTNHLLAGVVDLQQQGNFMWSDGKGPKPKPVPRPGVGQPKRSGTPHTREEVWQALRGIDPPEEATDDG
jgi:hypothetical protein